jgi:hypothetical protein
MRFIGFFLFNLYYITGFGQTDVKKDLDFYGDIMIYAYKSEHRMQASEQFDSLFDQYIAETDYSADDLLWLEWVSVLYPEDNSFRVVSWQVKENDSLFHYNAFVQFENGEKIKLNGGEEYWSKISYDEREPDDCPMALYYNMKQLSDKHYLLFGINEYNQYEKIKIAEVLVVEGNNIRFGAPIFTNEPEDPKYRLVLQYADDAVVSLNYNEDLELLIYDHLISRMGRIPNQGVTSLPDGSYEAYKIKRGKLEYIEKVYDHIYETAPRPMPKDESKGGKDIFGKKKG